MSILRREREISSDAGTSEGKERSSQAGFVEMVDKRQIAVNSLLCIGLDPDQAKILQIEKYKKWKEDGMSMEEIVFNFNVRIIMGTHHLVCAYKPNKAFYEEFELDGGLEALRRTINFIREADPTIPIILDAKRTDIGKTNDAYVKMIQNYGVDAVTVNPYFGFKALEPFFKSGKGIIVLCRTSNPEVVFQDRLVKHPELGEIPLYLDVAFEAERVRRQYPNVCIVVGATYPDELEKARKVFHGEILVPGLGTQGGKPEDLPGGFDGNKRGVIANNTSGIIYKSSGPDFAVAAGEEARKWRDAINAFR